MRPHGLPLNPGEYPADSWGMLAASTAAGSAAAQGTPDGAGYAASRWWPARPTRVIALVSTIVLLSAFDLLLTVTYASGTGFAEANPIARLMLRDATPESLAIWKACTVLPCVLTLLLGRMRRCAELGAWAGVIVLSMLAVHWTRYIEEKREIADLMGPYDYAEVMALDPDWVRLSPPSDGSAWLTRAMP